MRRDKPSSKQSEPATLHGRQVAYDRAMCIVICRRFLLGEDFRAICAKPPMPVEGVFLGWVQHHQEAREIHRCARNFLSDRRLAKELGAPWVVAVTDWAEEVRAKLERGWPVDYLDRKYIPPDWNKVYPLVSYPPVRSTEDMQCYNDIINDFTQMLEPRDVMELIWTKEAADAVWKAHRLARQKSGSSRVGSRYYQDLDIAQSREIKRRDNALRQIARWRDGLGGKVRDLPDKFLAEPALTKRYGVVQSFAGAATDDTAGEDMESAPPLARPGVAASAARPVPLPHEVARAAPPLASAGVAPGAAQPVPPPAARDAPPLASAAAAAKAAAPIAPPGTAAGAARPVPLPHEGARAAPPRAPAGDAVEAAQLVPPPDQAATDAPPLASAAAAVQAAPPLAPPAPAAGDARPVPLPHQAARAAPSLASAGAAVQAAPPFVPAGETPGAAPPLRASEQAAEAALPFAPRGAAMQAAAPFAPPDATAEAAPPLRASEQAAEAALPLACSDKAAETSEAA
jgi:Bacteriophage Sf6, terminase small subunit-like